MVTIKYIQIQLILNSMQGGGEGELDGTKGGHGGGGWWLEGHFPPPPIYTFLLLCLFFIFHFMSTSKQGATLHPSTPLFYYFLNL